MSQTKQSQKDTVDALNWKIVGSFGLNNIAHLDPAICKFLRKRDGEAQGSKLCGLGTQFPAIGNNDLFILFCDTGLKQSQAFYACQTSQTQQSQKDTVDGLNWKIVGSLGLNNIAHLDPAICNFKKNRDGEAQGSKLCGLET